MSPDQTATTPAATAPAATDPLDNGAATRPPPAITLRAYALAAVASMLRDVAPVKSHEVDFLPQEEEQHPHQKDDFGIQDVIYSEHREKEVSIWQKSP